MLREFRLPDLGEGIHEGEIVDVLVSVGDSVEDGQSIMVVETDKATTEIPSLVTGVVEEIKVKPGDTVNVGDVLITFRVEGEKEKEKKAEEAAKPAAREEKRAPEPPAAGREGPEPPAAEREGPVPASPSTRRLARELGVDLARVTPGGPGGQVTAEDVRALAEKAKEAPPVREEPPAEEAPKVAPPEKGPLPVGAKAPPLPDFGRWGTIERVPLRSVRRTTAKNMAMAWSQIPHVAHMDVADITELEAFRHKHKAEIEAQGGSLSLTVFALKAVVAALKAYPYFNASLDTEASEIVLKHYYHLGVAVDTDRGLIVPVIRDVDRKSISELAKELTGLIQRARDGKLDREELSGGSFTITNIGPLGGTAFVPIINYPQVAILGMAQSRLQPVVRGSLEDYRIVPRLMLPLILGFDHRVVDGADAARFVNIIIDAMEATEHLLMMI